MKFCPKCGTVMVIVRRGNSTYFKCPKCGYEEKVTKKDRKALVSRETIGEDRRLKVPVIDRGEEAEAADEDYRKQLLDNLQEMEDEFD